MLDTLIIDCLKVIIGEIEKSKDKNVNLLHLYWTNKFFYSLVRPYLHNNIDEVILQICMTVYDDSIYINNIMYSDAYRYHPLFVKHMKISCCPFRIVKIKNEDYQKKKIVVSWEFHAGEFIS
jgi:hypothetical protein